MGGSVSPGGLSPLGRCGRCARCLCSRCLYPPLRVLQVVTITLQPPEAALLPLLLAQSGGLCRLRGLVAAARRRESDDAAAAALVLRMDGGDEAEYASAVLERWRDEERAMA